MTKTSCRVLISTIKKEECEDEFKLKKELLHSTNTAAKTRSKITKKRNSIQVQVKAENVDDNKALLSLLALPKKKTFTISKITAEQIAKLINYIVNDEMSVAAASRKAGMSSKTARKYYQEYIDDSEDKIPLPKTRFGNSSTTVTQQKIEDLIYYIVKDEMNIAQASKKAGISRPTAAKYYAKYLEDPKRKTPLLAEHTDDSTKRYTQEKIADLIGYIVRDKMTVVEASKKVDMSPPTARRYYLQYLQNPNNEIPDPCESNQRPGKRCTNNQVRSLIGYVVNDGMTLSEASVKANMSESAASKYYKLYLDDPDNSIPTPETSNICKRSSPPTLDQIRSFFCYVIIDKLNVAQASLKAKISSVSGRKYYTRYLKNPTPVIESKDLSYSIEKMKRFLELVQNKKMSLKKAAEEVQINISSAQKHYHQYLKDPKYKFPSNNHSQYTQEDIKRLIDCIRNDKMSIRSAARSIKMNESTATRYYKKYQNDPKHRIPVPITRGHSRKNNMVDKYTQIVADIYKKNPSIKPMYGNYGPEFGRSDINIKQEEDVKEMLLKTEHN